jgi:hypothetical protein
VPGKTQERSHVTLVAQDSNVPELRFGFKDNFDPLCYAGFSPHRIEVKHSSLADASEWMNKRESIERQFFQDLFLTSLSVKMTEIPDDITIFSIDPLCANSKVYIFI